MVDVLVIGAGLSGLLAALTAAQAGLTVRVVAKGMGSLHWSAGTLDLLGYVPGNPQAMAAPFAAMDQLPAEHPYRLLGSAQVAAALRRLQEQLASAGLPYVGDSSFEKNILLPSPVGAARPVFLAPQAQSGGNLQDETPMVIVGVEGLRDTFPWLVAENLTRQGFPARAATVPWEAVSHQRDRNAVQLAAQLDDPAQHLKLARALKPLVRRGERLGLPAILGLEASQNVRAAIEAETGTTVFELPMLPPSVPGIRLFQTLRKLLQNAGVRIETNMEVVGFHSSDGRVEWVETATSARPLRHRARAYVLATGGILGGGITSAHDGRIWETVFNLPLTVESDRRTWFRPQFLDAGGQPVFHGGVRVADDFRASQANGDRAYENVWAVGGTLAHADPILERSLEGIAVATGTAAAQAIATTLAVGHKEPA